MSNGLTALAAIVRDSMAAHMADLERQIAEAATREAKLQRAFDEVRGDFEQFYADMGCMTCSLRQRIYAGMSDGDKRIFNSYHRSFWYLVKCAERKSEGHYPRAPRVEAEDEDDLDDELDVILNDPLPWPVCNGQYPAEMTTETYDRFRHLPLP